MTEEKKKKFKPEKGKKSRFKRTNKNGEEYYYYWNPNPLPQEGKMLKRYNPKEWKELAPSDQKLILIYYKQKGHSKLSLNEKADLCACSDGAIVKWQNKLIKKGDLVVEKRFRKNKDGKIGKRKNRSYAYLTTQGKKRLDNLMKDFFEKVFADEEEISTRGNEVPNKKNSNNSEGFEQEGELCSTKCQGESPIRQGYSSLDRKVCSFMEEAKTLSKDVHNFGDLRGKAYHSYLESCLDSLEKEKSNKNKSENSATVQKTVKKCSVYSTKEFTEVEKLFSEAGFSKELKEFHPKVVKAMCKEDMKSLEKNLALMKKKLEKGMRITKSFVAYLTYLMKNSKKGRGAKKWYPKLTDDHMDALNGKSTKGTKKLYEGATTSTIIASITQLQKDTGQKITRKDLSRLVRQRPEKLAKSLDHVLYRMKLGGVKKADSQTEKRGVPIYEERFEIQKDLVFNPKTGREEVCERKVKKQVIVGYKPYQEPVKDSKTKGKPIFKETWISKIVEIFSPKAGGVIKKEVRERKKVLIGHEVNLSSSIEKHSKYQPVRSWIGLLCSTLKLPSVEAIMELRKPKAKASVASGTI